MSIETASVPVVEQLNETEKIEQQIKQEYSLAPDGTIVKKECFRENPDSCSEMLK